jgi:hypothetical protein
MYLPIPIFGGNLTFYLGNMDADFVPNVVYLPDDLSLLFGTL